MCQKLHQTQSGKTRQNKTSGNRYRLRPSLTSSVHVVADNTSHR